MNTLEALNLLRIGLEDETDFAAGYDITGESQFVVKTPHTGMRQLTTGVGAQRNAGNVGETRPGVTQGRESLTFSE